MAPFAVWPPRSKYCCLLVDPPLCSFRHDPGFVLLHDKSASCFWYVSSAPYEKYLSDFSFALQCSFWVWLASLSIRLAVDSDACSSALSQARYAMTRVLFYCTTRVHRVFGMFRAPLIKNISLTFALHFSARFGYSSLRFRSDSQ